MEILHFEELGNTESVVTNAPCVYLVVDNLVYVPSCALPMYQILSKKIGQLVIEILYFVDVGDTESVITNAVVLVLTFQ